MVHIAIILCVVIGTEHLGKQRDATGFALAGLVPLAAYYLFFRAIRLQYVDRLELLINLGAIVVWIALIMTMDSWSGQRGWFAGFGYVMVTLQIVMFLVIVLFMNLVVHIVRRVRKRKQIDD